MGLPFFFAGLGGGGGDWYMSSYILAYLAVLVYTCILLIKNKMLTVLLSCWLWKVIFWCTKIIANLCLRSETVCEFFLSYSLFLLPPTPLPSQFVLPPPPTPPPFQSVLPPTPPPPPTSFSVYPPSNSPPFLLHLSSLQLPPSNSPPFLLSLSSLQLPPFLLSLSTLQLPPLPSQSILPPTPPLPSQSILPPTPPPFLLSLSSFFQSPPPPPPHTHICLTCTCAHWVCFTSLFVSPSPPPPLLPFCPPLSLSHLFCSFSLTPGFPRVPGFVLCLAQVGGKQGKVVDCWQHGPFFVFFQMWFH